MPQTGEHWPFMRTTRISPRFLHLLTSRFPPLLPGTDLPARHVHRCQTPPSWLDSPSVHLLPAQDQAPVSAHRQLPRIPLSSHCSNSVKPCPCCPSSSPLCSSMGAHFRSCPLQATCWKPSSPSPPTAGMESARLRRLARDPPAGSWGPRQTSLLPQTPLWWRQRFLHGIRTSPHPQCILSPRLRCHLSSCVLDRCTNVSISPARVQRPITPEPTQALETLCPRCPSALVLAAVPAPQVTSTLSGVHTGSTFKTQPESGQPSPPPHTTLTWAQVKPPHWSLIPARVA